MVESPIPYEHLFNIKSETDFNRIALQIFDYQVRQNKVYSEFVSLLNPLHQKPDHYSKIPFLPIQFFKTHDVISGKQKPVTTFFSSGTTKSNLSSHHVVDLELYDQSMLYGFELFFGPLSDYSIFAVLPSYHENQNASLLYMVDRLVERSGNTGGFFPENKYNLLDAIYSAKKNKKVMLIGVSYALIDLADELKPNLRDILIIETGGMKGRRKEMTKEDLHAYLKAGFQCVNIGSEYGMTELLSQAWSKGDGIFSCPPWMKILTREYNDPFQGVQNATGGINVIDFANLHSCSFIATQDLGYVSGNQFKITGRFDNSDLRGCNLLVT